MFYVHVRLFGYDRRPESISNVASLARSALSPFKNKFRIIVRRLLNALLYFNSSRSRASIVMNPLNNEKSKFSIIRRF